MPNFVAHLRRLGAKTPTLATRRRRELLALVLPRENGEQLHVQFAYKGTRLGVWAHLEPSLDLAPVAHALSAVLDQASFRRGCRELKRILKPETLHRRRK